ncbi:Uma2 family endonuclease [Chloroflexi bacterium TSY]|nr:Uma2 family endonuclease [Chloroflexi bacterium TSY]
MLATKERLSTIEEFDLFRAAPENRGRLFELIHGEIVKETLAEEHGVIALNIGFYLRQYTKQHKSGRAGVEIRHRILEDHHNSRLPDISFSSRKRPIVKRGTVPHMPDLAVEIQFPNDSIQAMRKTASYYLTNGAKLVWLVFPAQQIIEIHRPDADLETLTVDDTLTGDDVLPGFEMPVSEVFDDSME